MKRLCTATNLKLFAIILMVFDHIHQMFLPMGAPLWLAYLGRPVFPILLFLAADSFHYTHNRRKYLTRLLVGSWVMTISSFLLQKLLPNPNVVLMNNAFSTFFTAGLYMLFWDCFLDGIRKKDAKKIIASILLCFVPVLMAAPMFLAASLSFNENIPGSVFRMLAMAALLVPSVLTVEGGFAMVALGAAFYALRKWRWAQIAVLSALSVLVYSVSGGFQWMMVSAAVPMALYNGEKGKGFKQFFYLFYPAHIWILYILAALMQSS
ncbi:MAG: TraX family protein [Lachnospiraceae bacterium]|nr:TraX family protein [Lachnospiraceae bacterium]